MLLTYYVAQSVLFTVLLDFSHLYVYKQLKKAQMSGHVKTSPGPQNTLRPQRVNVLSLIQPISLLKPNF